MTTLYYGTIASLNENGTANVTIPDRENQIIQGLPVIVNEVLKPKDRVGVILEENSGKVEKGIVFGKIR